MGFSVRDPQWNIRTDGTDTWDTLQALFDAAGSQHSVDFDDGMWRVSKPIRMSVGGRYWGNFRNGMPRAGTLIQAIGPTNILEMPNLSPDGGLAAVSLEGLQLQGGIDQLYAPNGADWVTLRDVHFNGPIHAGIYGRGFLQNWSAKDIVLGGGQYGVYFPHETGRDGGSAILFDKCRFENVMSGGQTKNGWLILPTVSNSVHWERLTINNVKEDGFVFGGGIRMWTFMNATCEGNGYLGAPKPAESTPRFSDFKSVPPGGPGGGPGGISWHATSVGMLNGSNEMLYGMDLSHLVSTCSAYDSQNNRPIYDPNHLLKVYGRPLTVVG